MHELPADWSALCALVFLLGMRHGFDADHLAAIDGLTRWTGRRSPALARWCGSLFSLGHGAVVMSIAAAVGLMRAHWAPPGWLDAVGAWISIAFLVLLGVVNLRAVLAAAPGTVVGLVGIKGSMVERLVQVRGPFGVLAVGMLFAVSFDTVSQAALFAVTAGQFGGVGRALALGALFVLGMLATDGLNGWWIARLIARADQIAVLASRIMSVAVSAVSLLVAALGAARLLSPVIDGWSEGRELLFGGVVVGVVAIGYLIARQAPRRGLNASASESRALS